MIGTKVIIGIGVAFAAVTALPAQSQTSFQVSNVGLSAYMISGSSNPTLTLYRGVTYAFEVSAPGHPFWIKTAQVTGTGSAYSLGVTGNGTESGNVIFSVPMNAPDELYYNCQFHPSMTGVFQIENAPLEVGDAPAQPVRATILSSYPNPFNPATTIQFELPVAADVRVTIHDLLGQQVAILAAGRQETGNHQVRWDGRDQAGRSVPSGVYVARLVTPETTRSIRLVLLK